MTAKTTIKKIAWLLGLLVSLWVLLVVTIIGISLYTNFTTAGLEVDEKVVALTFDDGPHPVATLQLLDDLDRLGVKATFFVNGKHAERHPEIVAETFRRGHEIANHGWTHESLWQLMSSKPLAEVSRTNELVRSITGKQPRFLRPPFMETGPGIISAANELSMQIVGGTSYTNDWEEPDYREIASAVLEKVDPGGVIALHDGEGPAAVGEQQDRTPTVRAVTVVVEELHRQGYRFVSLEEMFALAAAAKKD